MIDTSSLIMYTWQIFVVSGAEPHSSRFSLGLHLYTSTSPANIIKQPMWIENLIKTWCPGRDSQGVSLLNPGLGLDWPILPVYEARILNRPRALDRARRPGLHLRHTLLYKFFP